MKRYNITPESLALDGVLIDVPRIKIDEAINGEWVRYEDAFRADGVLKMVAVTLRNPALGELSEWQLEQLYAAAGYENDG